MKFKFGMSKTMTVKKLILMFFCDYNYYYCCYCVIMVIIIIIIIKNFIKLNSVNKKYFNKKVYILKLESPKRLNY